MMSDRNAVIAGTCQKCGRPSEPLEELRCGHCGTILAGPFPGGGVPLLCLECSESASGRHKVTPKKPESTPSCRNCGSSRPNQLLRYWPTAHTDIEYICEKCNDEINRSTKADLLTTVDGNSCNLTSSGVTGFTGSRLCVDCTHYDDTCDRVLSPVDGKPYGRSCEDERAKSEWNCWCGQEETCGPDGKFWEGK